MKATIYIILCGLSISCKTTRITERTEVSERRDVRTVEAVAETREARATSESVIKTDETVVVSETVVETIWSPPDTARRQYKVATRETMRRTAAINATETVVAVASDTSATFLSSAKSEDKTIVETNNETVAVKSSGISFFAAVPALIATVAAIFLIRHLKDI